jgi:hypothetical protein
MKLKKLSTLQELIIDNRLLYLQIMPKSMIKYLYGLSDEELLIYYENAMKENILYAINCVCFDKVVAKIAAITNIPDVQKQLTCWILERNSKCIFK